MKYFMFVIFMFVIPVMAQEYEYDSVPDDPDWAAPQLDEPSYDSTYQEIQIDSAQQSVNYTIVKIDTITGEINMDLTQIAAAAQDVNISMTEIVAALQEAEVSMTEIVAALQEAEVSMTEIVAALQEAEVSITEIVAALQEAEVSITEIVAALQDGSVSIIDVTLVLQQLDYTPTQIATILQELKIDILKINTAVSITSNGKIVARALYDESSDYTQLFPLFLKKPLNKVTYNGPKLCHGNYWIIKNRDIDIDKIKSVYNRMKNQYPLAVVVLNKQLLQNSSRDKLLDVFGEFVVWLDCSYDPEILPLLAQVYTKYNDKIKAVVVGGSSLEGGHREKLPDYKTDLDARVYKIYYEFSKYALPGRDLYLLWHTNLGKGSDYNKSIIKALGKESINGFCTWNMPGYSYWYNPKKVAKINKGFDVLLGRKSKNLVGDWTGDVSLVFGRDLSNKKAVSFAKLKFNNVKKRCQENITRNFDGYIRCIGIIPSRYRIIEDIK